jgi:hypothetical protein
MQEIRMKLWRHDEDDWSIEVDGKLHGHVSLAVIDELAEYALVAAQHVLEHSSPHFAVVDGRVQ